MIVCKATNEITVSQACTNHEPRQNIKIKENFDSEVRSKSITEVGSVGDVLNNIEQKSE